jgi:hypothetical protein
MTVWLIGSTPSKPDQIPLRAGRPGAADRLREILEMSLDEYEAAFARANILASPPFDRRARTAGRRVRKTITEPAVVLGRDTWLAMGLPSQTRYFERVENFTLVPHPSGRNIIYNNPAMRTKLRETIEAIRL